MKFKDRFFASGEKVLNAHVLELTALGALVGQVSLDLLRRNPITPDMLLNQYLPISFGAAAAIGFLGMRALTVKRKK